METMGPRQSWCPLIVPNYVAFRELSVSFLPALLSGPCCFSEGLVSARLRTCRRIILCGFRLGPRVSGQVYFSCISGSGPFWESALL